MASNNYIQNLIESNFLKEEDLSELKSAVKKFPYFQAARALHLKALKNNENFKYNSELKITAAYTTDRKVLFDFICSKKFQSRKIKPEIKEKKLSLENNNKQNLKTPAFDKGIEKDIETANKELNLGKPFQFNKNEVFSFNQWLSLSSKKAILRNPKTTKANNKKTDLKTPDQETENTEQKKAKQNLIINRFIENSPKITRPSKTSTSDFKVQQISQNTQIMTETLAKVYLEQKKYDSAIKAYKILSLKYPKKSSFFANQIKHIKTLQNNK
ncbi:MAG: hypothetical protein ACK5H1_01635 [Tenacibaculum sp.]